MFTSRGVLTPSRLMRLSWSALLKALRNEMCQKELHEAILQERLRRMVDDNEVRYQPAEHD